MAANDLVKVVFNDFGAGTAETPIISVGKISPRQLILKHAPLSANDYKIYIKRDMASAYELVAIITSNTAGAVKKVYNFPTGLTYTFLQFKLVTANSVTVEEPELVFIYQTCDLESQAKRSDLPLVTVNLSGLITPINVASGFNPMGTYAAGTDYSVGDLVDYNGSSYLMYVDAAAGTLPTDTTKWQILSAVGAQGNGINDNAVGFDYTGGTIPKTLTVGEDADVSGLNTGDEKVTVGFSNAPYICDGTDDDVEIQAAVTDNPNQEILLKPGTYNFPVASNVDILLTDYQKITGSGFNTILKKTYIAGDLTEKGLLFIKGKTGIKISDLFIQGLQVDTQNGDKSGNGIVIAADAPSVTPSSQIIIDSCKFLDGESGIFVEGSFAANIYSQNLKISNIIAQNCEHAIALQMCAHVNIVNVSGEMVPVGIRSGYTQRVIGIWNSHDININNVYSKDAAVVGIYLRTQTVAVGLFNVNINNYIVKDGYFGIHIEALLGVISRVNISNFTVENAVQSLIKLSCSDDDFIKDTLISNFNGSSNHTGIVQTGENATPATYGRINNTKINNSNFICADNALTLKNVTKFFINDSYFEVSNDAEQVFDIRNAERLTITNSEFISSAATLANYSGTFNDSTKLTLKNVKLSSGISLENTTLAMENSIFKDIEVFDAHYKIFMFIPHADYFYKNITLDGLIGTTDNSLGIAQTVSFILQNILITNCDINAAYRGISFVKGENITVKNCKFNTTGNLADAFAGYFESIDGLKISDCSFTVSGVTAAAELYIKNCTNIDIRRCDLPQGKLSLSGTCSGVIDGITIQETITGAGAISPIKHTTHLVTTGINALTLQDGVEGSTKNITVENDGGTGTLTPANAANFTSLVFEHYGDCANLEFTNGKWYYVGGNIL